MANKIQIRRDTTANWTASNPILSQGELGLDTTLNKIKIGNGTAQWSALSFYTGNPSSLINGLHTVSLGSNGIVTLPGNIATNGNQLTGWSGNLDLNIDGSIQLSADANCELTLQANSHQWSFGTDGVLTLPNSGEIFDYAGGVGTPGIFISRTFQTPDNTNASNFGTNTLKLLLSDTEATEIGDYLSAGIGVKVWFNQGDSYPITSCVQVSTGIWTITATGMGNRFATFAAINTLIFIYTGATPNTYTNFPQYELAGAGAAVVVFKGGKSWYFDKTGDLNLPPSGTIRDSMTGDSLLNPTKLINGAHQLVLNVNGLGPWISFPESGGQQIQIQGTDINGIGLGDLALASYTRGVVISANASATDSPRRDWTFGTDSKLTLPKGSIISETANTIAFAPPTAAAGQSLVIRPTTVAWGLAASGYIVYGSPITVSVTTIGGSSYFGTVNYTFSGCTAEQLGRALTGQITFPGGNTGNPQTITWTIPANSNITTFTLTLGSAVGVFGTDFNFELNGLPDGQFVTVTNNGITNSEFSHVHLVAGNPTTVDIYLGDDDQYIKIEKNAGDVVIGTNLDTHQWTFGTDSKLTLPNASTISPVTQVGYSYGPYASDVYNNTTGGALSSGTQTVVNIGNTVHNDLFNPPVATATTTTGTIASNGDFEPGTSTGTFDLHTQIIVGGQSLGDLQYRDENNTAAGFTLAHPVTPYEGPVVTAGTLISGYAGWITRTPKTTTYIKWADGSSSQVTGSSVNQYPNDIYGGLITADNVSGKSFPATLYTANYIPSGTAISVNSNDWKFDINGKLNLPGSTFIDTSPNYIHASHGIGLHPSHNTGGTGPELYIYYNDGIVVQPFTNDYLTPGNAASPLFITGSNLPNTNDSIGKLPGDIYIKGGRNVKDETYGKVVVNSGTNQWKFNSSGQLIFPDTTIQTTAFRDVASNVFFVDPSRTGGTYTRTGTFTSPYNSITAAFDAAVAAGFDDSFTATVILMNNTAENITLRPGIFLTSLGTGTHGAPLLAGTVTVTSSTGTTASNHYSISNLRIIAEGDNHCINVTGTAPQKLFMRDLWLDVSGTGNGIRVNNTGTGSTVHIDTGHLAHHGTGDVYCINVINGNCYVTDIETTGTTQVAAVRTGCTLTLDSCELDTNGDIVCETYGTGTLVITNSAITNAKANSTGILINDAGGTVTLGNNIITVPAGTGYAVQGPLGGIVYHANNVFTANSYRSTAIDGGFIALPNTWQTKA